MASVFEAARVVDAGHEDLGIAWSDTGDRLNALDPWIVLADLFELLDDDVELIAQRIQQGQFDVQFAFPQFIGFALSQRFTEGVDAITAGMPGFVAGIDRDAMVDEPSADSVLELVDPLVERLSVFHERTELTVFGRWHVNRLEFFHGDHASEFKRVVFIGLASDVGPQSE